MAGSHRAPAPPRRSGRAWTALVIVIVVAAITGGFYLTHRSGSSKPKAAPPTSTSTPTPTPTGTPEPSTTPSPSVSPPSTHSAKPLPRVRRSAPKRLVAGGLFDVGFDSTVAPHDGLFTPRSTAEVARWGARGLPGSPTGDTVYVIGKVSTKGAFAKLARLRRGVRISLQTQTGVLTYTVHSVVGRQARGLTADPGFKAAVRNRLQLVGIRYDAKGNRTGTVVLVTARLTGARRS